MLFTSLRRAGIVSVAMVGALSPSSMARTRHRDVTPDSGVDTNRLIHRTVLRRAQMLPSYSRQTGLACNVCHFQFPQLTPFGRQFKLNGYTMTGLKTIRNMSDSTQRQNLSLSPIPPLSAMFVTSLTALEKRIPDTQNASASFPQQASLFLAGEVAPRVGVFAQFTYSASSGKFGIDNVDIRYADHGSLGGRDLLYGVTLHNNPTVQDVFNTVPAWSWPFMGSQAAPMPAASPLVQGALGQSVAGLGVYGLWNNLLYSEFTMYTTAQQGTAPPPDSSARNVLRHVTPYGRVVVTRDAGSGHVSLGAFGMDSRLYVAGVGGATDHYVDMGADVQYESRTSGDRVFILRSAFIHERQTTASAFEAAAASVATRSVDDFRASATFMPSATFGYTVGGFATSGTRDALHYAPASTSGSRTGSPNSSGALGEMVVNPWQNFRLGIQYTRFFTFNGAATNYDGSGRNASDNNRVYLYSWIVF